MFSFTKFFFHNSRANVFWSRLSRTLSRLRVRHTISFGCFRFRGENMYYISNTFQQKKIVQNFVEYPGNDLHGAFKCFSFELLCNNNYAWWNNILLRFFSVFLKFWKWWICRTLLECNFWCSPFPKRLQAVITQLLLFIALRQMVIRINVIFAKFDSGSPSQIDLLPAQ